MADKTNRSRPRHPRDNDFPNRIAAVGGGERKSNQASSGKELSAPKRNAQGRAGDIDYTFLFTVVLLLAVGLIMVLSASAPAGASRHGDSYYFFKRQLVFALIGVVGMVIISRVDYREYKKYTPIMMVTVEILLLIVLIPGIGIELNGSRRWLPMPGFQLQPSEFMKPVIAMFFAYLVEKQQYDITKIKGTVTFWVWIGITMVLMLCETHLSGAIVIAGIAVVVMICAGMNVKPFAICAAGGIPAVLFAIYQFMPNRWERVMSFLQPFADTQGSGYQVVQSLYAIGSGGLFGLGLGQSVQKYSYLPEPYNDFIFAIVCEELGLIGAALIICLFAALIMRGLRIALEAPDKFGSLTVIGIMAHIAIQTVFNIAVATSSIPNTGISLPFFSYGGTAIIVLLWEMGVVLSISRFSAKRMF